MRMRASWFGSLRPTGYKVAARVPRARQRAPLGCVIPTTTSVPPCSGLSRCGLETTERAATAERRPTLTAPARAGLHHVRVGAKKRDSKSNKETGMKEVENGSNKRLTSTASYKAGYMTAPNRFAESQIPLASRAPSGACTAAVYWITRLRWPTAFRGW